jgi:geranylgeranyl diphosphate synthase, type I
MIHPTIKIDSPPQAPISSQHLASFTEIKSYWAEIIEQKLQKSLIASGHLRQMVTYHLASGGKRFRALLPGWLCNNLGGYVEDAIDTGIGLELLHNASLIHDDLQDRSPLRREKLAIWKKWGDEQAINAGDALILEAMHYLSQMRDADRIVNETTTALIRVIEGQSLECQLQQLTKSPGPIELKLDHWISIAHLKTASLFEVALRLGAVVANASSDLVEEAGQFGVDLGLLFQAQDDYLDFIDTTNGPLSGNDLWEGKPSFPILWALENANPNDSQFLLQILKTPATSKTPELLQEGISIIKDCGAISALQEWLLFYREKAQAHPIAKTLPGIVSHLLLPMEMYPMTHTEFSNYISKEKNEH